MRRISKFSLLSEETKIVYNFIHFIWLYKVVKHSIRWLYLSVLRHYTGHFEENSILTRWISCSKYQFIWRIKWVWMQKCNSYSKFSKVKHFHALNRRVPEMDHLVINQIEVPLLHSAYSITQHVIVCALESTIEIIRSLFLLSLSLFMSLFEMSAPKPNNSREKKAVCGIR